MAAIFQKRSVISNRITSQSGHSSCLQSTAAATVAAVIPATLSSIKALPGDFLLLQAGGKTYYVDRANFQDSSLLQRLVPTAAEQPSEDDQ